MSEEFSIEKFKTDQMVLMKTLAQIEKDFDFIGIEIKFKAQDTLSLEGIAEKLRPEIAALMQKNYQGFLNLLYRIDLNETRLKREIANNKDTAVEQIICELIIKRELQKVVIRSYFSR
ncbi:MAG: hypothetical protein IAF38_19925 [Bacteroidia bacterium]|nr:hypothetical protein [Bacteroidia bacterium]